MGPIDVAAGRILDRLSREEVLAVALGDLGTLARFRAPTLVVEAVRVRCLVEVTR